MTVFFNVYHVSWNRHPCLPRCSEYGTIQLYFTESDEIRLYMKSSWPLLEDGPLLFLRGGSIVIEV